MTDRSAVVSGAVPGAALGLYPVTPLVRQPGGIFLKCEFLHPGRSHKARVAAHLIDDAEHHGWIDPTNDVSLLERTGGNLGIGLAIEARARGYRLTLIVDRGYSRAKRELARKLGAVVLEREEEFPTCADNGAAIAALLATDGDHYHYLNQFANPANPQTHELDTGPEIASQLRAAGVTPDQRITLICGTGTGATMRGVSRALRNGFVEVVTVGVQPPGCELSAGTYGPHPFQGIAVGEPAPFYPPGEFDDIIRVSERDAELARTELMSSLRFDVGPSSLANYAAALRYRARYGSAHNPGVFVTVLFDRGEDYV
ncbi:cysteine synthase A [Nocardia transvalensis]|uniref:Cysteine synthase A n=1 Tax=Nocardia transvalensis TaxID=37333 RepID=A0A7W9PBJ0_9NOCA|nr:pyridoxal-phosphate dependent enzyme [Nocardia transvalensis]MBB5912995.1 cysteine synthase A [Nocardia transvalensis]